MKYQFHQHTHTLHHKGERGSKKRVVRASQVLPLTE
jgi:hypothetical protein